MAESAESVALEMAKTIAGNAPGLTHLNFEQDRFIALYLDCLAATKGERRATAGNGHAGAISDRLRP